MRILFIHTFYTLKGGEDAVFENDVLEMTRRGHDVEALIFENEKSSLFKLVSLPFNLSSYRQTRKTIRDFKPDLVHLHNFHFAASPSVIRAIKYYHVPCVMTLHNFRLICPSATLYHKQRLYLSSLKERFPWKAVWDGVYRNSKLLTFWLAFSNWINRTMKTWNIVDRFIIPNSYAKNIFETADEAIFKNKMVVKPNYIKDPMVGARPREDHFLYVGRLSEEKGLVTLLEAHQLKKFKLTIIGDGPMSDAVKHYASREHTVIYRGFMNREEILCEMSRCGALILPSVCMEMNPLTMIEAMSCGTPVIAADLPTLEEYVTDEYNGLLFKSNDAASLAGAISIFLQMTPDQKAKLGNQARTTFEQVFTREKHEQAMDLIYSALV